MWDEELSGARLSKRSTKRCALRFRWMTFGYVIMTNPMAAHVVNHSQVYFCRLLGSGRLISPAVLWWATAGGMLKPVAVRGVRPYLLIVAIARHGEVYP